MRIAERTASEWSGLSTRAQSELCREYDVIVVTWWGKPDLIVMRVDGALGKLVLDKLEQDECQGDGDK